MDEPDSGGGEEMTKTVAHIHHRYSPARLDLHNELSKRGVFNSVLITERYIPRSVEPYPGTRYLFKAPSGNLFYRVDKIVTENPIYRRSLTRFFIRNIKESHASIMHAHFGMTGYRAMDAVAALKLPFVLTLYGVDGSYCLKDTKWIGRFKKLFSAADRIVVLCEEVKRRVAALGYPEEKIRIWNCLEDITFYSYTKRPKVNGAVNFMIAARFVEKKGYPMLLGAFKRIHTEHPDVRLTMIGYGPGRAEVAENCKRLGISGSIEIVPTDEVLDFPSLYKGHLAKGHIFVMPSIAAKDGDDEGGPALSLIAAQASGLPVIATRFPGAERSVVDNVTGIYTEADEDSLYERMLYLYMHPELWDKLGEAASLYVKKEFSVPDQVVRMESIYEELV